MSFRAHVVLFSSLFLLVSCGGKKEDSGSTATSGGSDAAAAASLGDSAISGSVKFTGTKPKAKKIQMTADAFCKTVHPTSVESEEVVVNPNGTLKNVYIYVKSGLAAGLKFPAPKGEAVLDQQGCLYTPHVIAIQANQPLVIKNSDGVLHNINARPKNNPGFNIGQPVKDMKTTKTFPNPEVMIPIKCDVHPWMGGYIGVQAHPYAAVSDGSGSFSLQGLPAGTYEIEAWHEVYGTSKQTITVGAKEQKSITFTFKGA